MERERGGRDYYTLHCYSIDPPFVNLTLNGSTIWTVGSDVILKCPNTGMPAPDILWTRNETRFVNRIKTK